MNSADVVLAVLCLALAAAALAGRLRTPAPVVLAAIGLVAGLAWELVPALPALRVQGDTVLLVFLPPLLFSAAYSLPLGAFRKNLGPILLLAIGLVVVTMGATALVAHGTAPFPWAVAFLLGAIVAPPDPVAATSIAEQTGLATRLVVILEGEGLVNDAVAIVAYGLALDAARTGEFTWTHAAIALALEAPGGALVGLALAWAVVRLRKRLDNVLMEAGLMILVPYVAYHLADRLGMSGVLAVVALGFVLRREEMRISTPVARLAARTVLAAVRFSSTVLVFLLVGVVAGEVIAFGLSWPLIRSGLAVAVTAVLVRLAWMYTVPRLYNARGPRRREARTPTWGELTVIGWAGMRGVVTLALALAVPTLPALRDGSDPRFIILGQSLAVILVTLVFQGVTLLPLIRGLGVGDPASAERDEHRARTRARHAGLAALERLAREEPALATECEDLTRHVRDGGVGIAAAGFARLRGTPGEPLGRVLMAQRMVVEELRNQGRLGPSIAEELITELDVDAMSARGDSARLTSA